MHSTPSRRCMGPGRKEAVVWMNWNSGRGGDFGGKGNMRWTGRHVWIFLDGDRPLDSRAAEWFPANGSLSLHMRKKETFPPQISSASFALHLGERLPLASQAGPCLAPRHGGLRQPRLGGHERPRLMAALAFPLGEKTSRRDRDHCGATCVFARRAGRNVHPRRPASHPASRFD